MTERPRGSQGPRGTTASVQLCPRQSPVLVSGRVLACVRAGPSEGQMTGVEITADNRGAKLHIGVYETPEAVHAAYCKAADELHGDFARVA